MYDVQVKMHLSDQENALAYGIVTIENMLRFSVTVRKYKKDSEEIVFISFPRILKKGEWSNVLTIEPELKEQIQKAVGEALKYEIMKDWYLAEIEDVQVTPIHATKQGKAVIHAMASVKICGITIHGITIKKGEHGFFVNMPQFQSNGNWKDIVYAINVDMQKKIKDTVLEEYKNILEGLENETNL